MIKVNVSDAKARLSALLELVRGGARVQICVRNVPTVELKPLATPKQATSRSLGLCEGHVQIPPSFFEPLPEDVLGDFENPA